MSLVVRKLAFCICENKDTDQLCGNHEADQRLCFCHMDTQSFYFLNTKFQASSHLLGCTAWFVSDLVGNPKYQFSHNEAHIFLAEKNKGTKHICRMICAFVVCV